MGRSEIAVPDFADGSAAPFVGFLEDLSDLEPAAKIVIILDEFDELPPAMFGPDDLARSFFNTLRAASNQSHVGMILVGGEKMEFALALQGDPLNKFREERVDFLDLENNFGDFARLVREPASSVLEISDQAVSAIHDTTVGHPYFTKMVCGSIWQRALDKRDAHVTPNEVADAVDRTIDVSPVTSFQHFWSDGIHGSAEERATVSLQRRRLFIALAEALRRSSPAEEADVVKEGERVGMSRVDVSTLLAESVRRDVIVQQAGGYVPRIPLFGRWLIEHGPARIGSQLGGSDVIEGLRAREESLRVTAVEIKEVIARWGTYMGVSATADDVRAWLEQFSGPSAQRLMFKILKGLRFYNGARITEAFIETYSAIMRGRRGRAASRADVLVSYLDGAGKSGPEMATKFRRVNEIAFDNVFEMAELPDGVARLTPKTIIFVDDFVATGDSVAEGLAQLDTVVHEYMRTEDVRVGFACVAGFDAVLRHVADAFKALGVRGRVHAADDLTDADRCFHPHSRFFESEEERVTAELIAVRAGELLERNHPAGYGNVQAAVVFEGRCPNNTLPVLWASSSEWIPLFPRHR
jgi:hypothetical protein